MADKEAWWNTRGALAPINNPKHLVNEDIYKACGEEDGELHVSICKPYSSDTLTFLQCRETQEVNLLQLGPHHSSLTAL